MVEHIIKSLTPRDIASVLLVLGLVKEVRRAYKATLDYKVKIKELQHKKQSEGRKPQALLIVYHHLPKKAMSDIGILALAGAWFLAFLCRKRYERYLEKKLKKMEEAKNA